MEGAMSSLRERGPSIAVLSSLFPSAVQPGAGLFVRERMFRVGRELMLTVVAPTPWFPLQALIRRWHPHFRPGAPKFARQGSVEVWSPRFFSMPGKPKSLDGFFMALAALPRFRALKREGRADIIDAHFGYPDGYAATLLGRWLNLPVTITLRGTEGRHARDLILRPLLKKALTNASRIFAVSGSLRDVAISLGIPPDRVRVIGNGVDMEKFRPMARLEARRNLGIGPDAEVLISVGGLVERKGFHRVIDCLPELLRRHPTLVYLIVGGPSPEGDWSGRLKSQVDRLGLDCVRFLGALPSERLREPLSTADVFVLATSNEGWANVLLEAMACGLPVVTTNVGGNAQVVCSPALGTVVPLGDESALTAVIDAALVRHWDSAVIRQYAAENSWDIRVAELIEEFRAIDRNDVPPTHPSVDNRAAVSGVAPES
jgi:glycosyltransferase involved in cell wall biosynthesis